MIKINHLNHNFLHLLNRENPTEHFGKFSQFILMLGNSLFEFEIKPYILDF